LSRQQRALFYTQTLDFFIHGLIVDGEARSWGVETRYGGKDDNQLIDAIFQLNLTFSLYLHFQNYREMWVEIPRMFAAPRSVQKPGEAVKQKAYPGDFKALNSRNRPSS